MAITGLADAPGFAYSREMVRRSDKKLRRGWTTGACATAATKAALDALWGAGFPASVGITLPKGERPEFALAWHRQGVGWAEAGIVKDAGDDPDVTHGALIVARVADAGPGLSFHAGRGVGTVTRDGLPLPVGEPAINPAPRRMMRQVVAAQAAKYGRAPDIAITIAIPGGEELALKTWNPRLGIVGGLSVLGTTGIVRPFSCAAWIAAIHRGIDVALAGGLEHVAACTGATSQSTVQALYALPDHAMLDMGDFAGGVLKYLRRHPVARLSIGGGIGKITKLAQGAMDLHSRRSNVDIVALNQLAGGVDILPANTALEALERAGNQLAEAVAEAALTKVKKALQDTEITCDIVIVDRSGQVLARAGPR